MWSCHCASAWYVARHEVRDDQWGRSHFNWEVKVRAVVRVITVNPQVDGVNYHVLRKLLVSFTSMGSTPLLANFDLNKNTQLILKRWIKWTFPPPGQEPSPSSNIISVAGLAKTWILRINFTGKNLSLLYSFTILTYQDAESSEPWNPYSDVRDSRADDGSSLWSGLRQWEVNNYLFLVQRKQRLPQLRRLYNLFHTYSSKTSNKNFHSLPLSMQNVPLHLIEKIK